MRKMLVQLKPRINSIDIMHYNNKFHNMTEEKNKILSRVALLPKSSTPIYFNLIEEEKSLPLSDYILEYNNYWRKKNENKKIDLAKFRKLTK